MPHRVRRIEKKDNPAVADIVISVLTEFGCTGEGYAYADPELSDLYSVYQDNDAALWVVEDTDTGEILGSGGFSRLRGTSQEEGVCELQKFYFKPHTRGLGLGKQIVAQAMEQAKKVGYKHMYLETVEPMKSALGLYRKFGFEDLPGPKGSTGHFNCTVFMGRDL